MTYAGEVFKPVGGLGWVITGIMVVCTLAGCSGNHGDSEKKADTPAPVIKGVLLETVTTTTLPETMEMVGTVRARTSAVVSARIPGTISVLKVREGDRVRKGQLLVQLDAQENQANAAVAVSGVDEAQRGLEEARSRKKMADTTFARYQNLFKEQAISRQEFDVKQTERDLASQGVARAEARLKQTQSGSRAASAISGYTRILAPISGIITSKQADLGATVFPAQPLMTIEDEGSYQLELSVPESIAPIVKPGTAVQVTLDAMKTAFNARISEIVPAADPASRTFIAKVALGQKGLKSGMFGRGAISLGTKINGLLVPRKAIVEQGALTSVWVVDKNALARMRLVKVGKTFGDNVEVLSGLSDGERIAVAGVEKVSEGSKVE
ncbi:MAG: efflux RND transporter periplasmic adaptor subunit [Geobacteraceae bacterium]|nr:efflux RND transporter periplasmic adaptor subunit [Geobacteraceae bacterium]